MTVKDWNDWFGKYPDDGLTDSVIFEDAPWRVELDPSKVQV